ncbi:MAG: hypothetical protein JSV83_13065 [Desulfobacterales bacterium]|nr:MAG: hypothetical protein JSV83_13065 [Desulfobacterales bacterium]
MNALAASIDALGSIIYLAILGILCGLLMLCFLITIHVLGIRRQLNELSNKFIKIMNSLSMLDEDEKEKSIKARKGLKLDNADIEKLKQMGVGMD